MIATEIYGGRQECRCTKLLYKRQTMIEKELSKNNTFIFNWVDNYGDKIQNIKETFESPSLNNGVEIFDHLTYEELQKEVDRLRLLNFSLFNHITVIILDNSTKQFGLITTKDKTNRDCHVMIQTEILSMLKTNETLADVSRLFVIQKLDDLEEEEDDYIDYNEDAVNRLNSLKYMPEGLEFSLCANEYNNNFNASPFVNVFCDEMLNSTTLSMDKIYSNILKTVKKDRKYDINIEFAFNQRRTQDGIIRHGPKSTDEERDFIQ